MDEPQASALQWRRTFIIKELSAENARPLMKIILPKLIDLHILHTTEEEELQHVKTGNGRVSLFIDILKRSGPKAFDEFCFILACNSFEKVSAKLKLHEVEETLIQFKHRCGTEEVWLTKLTEREEIVRRIIFANYINKCKQYLTEEAKRSIATFKQKLGAIYGAFKDEEGLNDSLDGRKKSSVFQLINKGGNVEALDDFLSDRKCADYKVCFEILCGAIVNIKNSQEGDNFFESMTDQALKECAFASDEKNVPTENLFRNDLITAINGLQQLLSKAHIEYNKKSKTNEKMVQNINSLDTCVSDIMEYVEPENTNLDSGREKKSKAGISQPSDILEQCIHKLNYIFPTLETMGDTKICLDVIGSTIQGNNRLLKRGPFEESVKAMVQNTNKSIEEIEGKNSTSNVLRDTKTTLDAYNQTLFVFYQQENLTDKVSSSKEVLKPVPRPRRKNNIEEDTCVGDVALQELLAPDKIQHLFTEEGPDFVYDFFHRKQKEANEILESDLAGSFNVICRLIISMLEQHNTEKQNVISSYTPEPLEAIVKFMVDIRDIITNDNVRDAVKLKQALDNSIRSNKIPSHHPYSQTLREILQNISASIYSVLQIRSKLNWETIELFLHSLPTDIRQNWICVHQIKNESDIYDLMEILGQCMPFLDDSALLCKFIETVTQNVKDKKEIKTIYDQILDDVEMYFNGREHFNKVKQESMINTALEQIIFLADPARKSTVPGKVTNKSGVCDIL